MSHVQPSTILFQHYILFFLNATCKFLLSSWSPLAWITVIRAGLPNKLFNQLEMAQNSVARVIICTRSIDHITPLLIQLHLICSLFFVLLHTTQVSALYFHGPHPHPHPAPLSLRSPSPLNPFAYFTLTTTTPPPSATLYYTS